MRKIANPNQQLMRIFGFITLLGLVAALYGFFLGGNDGFVYTIVGLIFGAIFGIIIPILHVTGKKQIGEIEQLIAGQNLLVYWQLDTDEWARYTANEYARGVKESRKLAVWTFTIAFGMLLVGGIIGGALSAAYLTICLAIGGVLTGLFGGFSLWSTRSNHAANQVHLGEVFIGPNAIYFAGRYYSWGGAWASLEKVDFELGDPAIMAYTYRQGTGDSSSPVEVRIPVPRGREAEAESLVATYYAAS
jgi:hypothetical protein